MEPVSFPYVIVRYQKDDFRKTAVIIGYAVSLQQASMLLRVLIDSEQYFDPMAMYAIRDAAECAACPSFYSCACGQERWVSR